MEESTTLGPMTKSNSIEFLKKQFQKAKEDGAISHLDHLGDLNPSGQFIRREIFDQCW